MTEKTAPELKNVRDSISMLSDMTKLCVSQYKNSQDADLRALKDLVSVVNTLNPLITQHFASRADEIELKYSDLEIDKLGI